MVHMDDAVLMGPCSADRGCWSQRGYSDAVTLLSWLLFPQSNQSLNTADVSWYYAKSCDSR
jgi:hypothetical protein